MSFLFWAITFASLILSILALLFKRPKFLIIAAILILPMSLYLAMSPSFKVWGIIFPFFFAGASILIRKYTIWLSIILISPNFLLVGWLAYVVLNQPNR